MHKSCWNKYSYIWHLKAFRGNQNFILEEFSVFLHDRNKIKIFIMKIWCKQKTIFRTAFFFSLIVETYLYVSEERPAFSDKRFTALPLTQTVKFSLQMNCTHMAIHTLGTIKAPENGPGIIIKKKKKRAHRGQCCTCHVKGQGHRYSFSVGAQGLKNVHTKYEPRHEKTWLRDFRLGKTQTGLCSYRS